ncbi:hypothetical protein [Streptomyces sp. NPDC006134]
MPPKNTQPKYRQIADYLRDGILRDTFPADRFPGRKRWRSSPA